MSKPQILNILKEKLAKNNGVMTQDKLAEEVVNTRGMGIKETYYIVRELIDNNKIQYSQDDTGKYTIYG